MSKEEKHQIDIIQSPRDRITKLVLNNSKPKIKKNDYIGLTNVSHNQYIKLRELWDKLQK